MGGGEQRQKPVSLFYSYSHKDEGLRQRLEDHLAALRRSELIAEWHDRNIDVGDEWVKEIDDNLSRADIILLLVSASFIASSKGGRRLGLPGPDGVVDVLRQPVGCAERSGAHHRRSAANGNSRRSGDAAAGRS